MDQVKPPAGDSDANQKAAPGLDRRSVIKGAFAGALALGGAFTPTIKAFAQSGASLSFTDVDVTASGIIGALRDTASHLIGPSDALKTSIVDKLNQANSALAADQISVALTRLDEAEVIITNNQVELDNANGALEVETDETALPFAGALPGPGTLSPGIFRKLGDLLKRGVQFVKNLGTGIKAFVQRILATRIACIFRCMKAFAKCINKALSLFTACFDVCKLLSAIPFIGNALFVACAIVCALLVKNQVQACLAAFQACLRGC